MVETFYTKTPVKRKSLIIKNLIRDYLKMYCDRSTIHGVRYLFDDSLNEIERLCWTAIVITSITITFISFTVLSQRYNDQTLITVVEDSQYPVFNVHFPAVGICNQKRINWDKFEESKAQFLPQNTTPTEHAIYHELVSRMESLRFGSFESFANMEDIDLEKIDFINVNSLAEFLAFTCKDMFDGACIWRKKEHSCCELFQLEKTEVGYCLVFNSAITVESKMRAANDSFYPWRNAKSGEDSGLDITLKLKSSNATDTDEGVFLMIKKSEQWTDVVYSIKGNTDTLVVIRPELTVTDSNAKDSPPENRGCIFDVRYDEWSESHHPLFKKIPGLAYMQWNCFNVCHQQYLLQYCNCSLSLFFPMNESLRECRPSDFRCMYKFHDVFSFDKRMNEESYVKNLQGGMLCPCLISCDALDYFVTVSTLPIFSERTDNTKIITIDVHYQSEVMLKYRTSREFTYIEMIASLGGIIGLFLGASVVSVVEVIYHLTFGLYIFLKNNHFFDYISVRFQKFYENFNQHRISSSPPSSCASSAPSLKSLRHKSTNRRRY